MKRSIVFLACLLLAIVTVMACTTPSTTPTPATVTPTAKSTTPATSIPATITPTTKPTPPSSTTAATTTGTTYTLKLSTYTAPNHQWSIFIKELAALTKQRSNGRLIIDAYYGGTLFPSKSELKGLDAGSIDMAFVYFGSYPEVGPSLMLTNVPFAAQGTPDCSTLFKAFVDGKAGDLFNKEIQANSKAQVVNWVMVASGDFITTKKMVKVPEDMKGQRIRSGSPLHSEWLRMMGASPLDIAGPETYTALQLNTADGSMTSLSMYFQYKFNEVAKYYTMSVASYDVAAIVISKDSYAKLPPDLQKILMDTWQEWRNRNIEYNQKQLTLIRDDAKAHLQGFYEFTPVDAKAWGDKYTQPLVNWLLSSTKASPDLVKNALAIFSQYIPK